MRHLLEKTLDKKKISVKKITNELITITSLVFFILINLNTAMNEPNIVF